MNAIISFAKSLWNLTSNETLEMKKEKFTDKTRPKHTQYKKIDAGKNRYPSYENEIWDFVNKMLPGAYWKRRYRHNMIRNPETGEKLELDIFSPVLNIALEHQGSQHFYYNPFFHKTEEDFHAQQRRDFYKARRCNELGIKLICVPYNIHIQSLYDFIMREMA